LILDQITATML